MSRKNKGPNCLGLWHFYNIVVALLLFPVVRQPRPAKLALEIHPIGSRDTDVGITKMRISRDADGLRFVAECTSETGFVPEDVHCVRCGRRIDPLAEGRDLALRCRYCRSEEHTSEL